VPGRSRETPEDLAARIVHERTTLIAHLVLVMVWNHSGESNLPFPTAIAVVSMS
jgi:hypothetical protein